MSELPVPNTETSRDPKADRTFVVGLTGGAASGKTTVGAFFRTLGIEVVEADQVARLVVAPGQPPLQRIVAHFGSQILDSTGALDRGKLRAIVFSDATQRTWLEQLLHPAIRQGLWQAAAAAKSPYCILDIPLLVESGMTEQFDRIAVVDSQEVVQRQRLQQRYGDDTEQIDAVLKAQTSRQRRLAVADDVIDNNGAQDELEFQVKKLHRHYIELAQHKKSGG